MQLINCRILLPLAGRHCELWDTLDAAREAVVLKKARSILDVSIKVEIIRVQQYTSHQKNQSSSTYGIDYIVTKI